ncbi:TetR/AcrR family transcriptional regulator [Levilactobacillus sp. N40-8-2]|uniref:TetR/AcrR family transcriptional regulator n=1 Tax=Levilactobacillus muriae TaxID=3238987 RepID=UPI0038B33128
MATNQQRRKQQRQNILAAATKLFMRDGFKDTRIKDVAAAASVSQVTLYKYFDSKLALGHQIVLDLIEEGYADYQKMVDDHSRSFRELIELMITTKTTYARGINNDFYQFVADDMRGEFGNDEAHQVYDDGKKRFWDSVIARGRAAGFIAPTLSDEALMMYLDMYVQYFSSPTSHPTFGDAIDYKKYADQLMHLFFYGFIGAPPANDDESTKE